MVFNWKRAGRLFRELLLQERRGLLCNGALQRLWEGSFQPAGEETKEIAVKHRVTPVQALFSSHALIEPGYEDSQLPAPISFRSP